MKTPEWLDPRARVVLIAGPTASGKSAIAMQLADVVEDAVIINADSMQVYHELRIITARPSARDEARHDHRLYGFVPAERSYSVGQWLRDVTPIIHEMDGQGRLAIIVGGTGLYFKALTDGLANVPTISAETKEYWRHRLDSDGTEALQRELARLDPKAARRPITDPQRLLRALAVAAQTGRSLSDWQAEGQVSSPLKGTHVQSLVTVPERDELYRRINTRVGIIFDDGALDEVASLLNLGLSADRPAMKAIGVPEIRDFLAGHINREDLNSVIATATRRYAKRQLTWIRNQMRDWTHLSP